MATPYVMPKLAMAMNEGTVNEWLVNHGDKVEVGQALASVETEKVAYDVESPENGYLCIVLPVGETVACEELIAYFCDTPQEVAEIISATSGAPPNASSVSVEYEVAAAVTPVSEAAKVIVPDSVPAEGSRIIASPLAKKMGKDASLDLRAVAGTGPGGRIVKRDVSGALERGLQHAPAQMSAMAQVDASRELARIPMTGARKTISERMMQSLQTTAQLSSGWESDITDMLAARSKFVSRAEQLGTKVSVNAFIVKAIAYGIKQVPIVNACQKGNDVVVYDNINMGIAISMPGATEFDSSLVVAVLHNVERMGVVEIDREMKALINRVRSGQATADELSGSTITLSSTAGIAPPGMTTTPVLNLPNAALVAPSTPVDKPAVHKGEIMVRTMMPVSFTFDHRLLNGEPAARFMNAMHEALENPELMLA